LAEGDPPSHLRQGIPKEEAAKAAKDEGEIPFATVLRCRIRYFTDGAVIGSRGFVNETFARSRDRFGPQRKDGARKLRGATAPAAGVLWSARPADRGVNLGPHENPLPAPTKKARPAEADRA
jgi:putative transposase